MLALTLAPPVPRTAADVAALYAADELLSEYLSGLSAARLRRAAQRERRGQPQSPEPARPGVPRQAGRGNPAGAGVRRHHRRAENAIPPERADGAGHLEPEGSITMQEGRVAFPAAWADAMAAHEARLVKGQRVRVKLNPECDTDWWPSSANGAVGFRGHHWEEDGVTGEIIAISTSFGPASHPYLVRRAAPLYVSRLRASFLQSMYAATELEVIED